MKKPTLPTIIRGHAILSAAAALAFALTGCGDDDGNGGPSSGASSVSTPTPTPTPTPKTGAVAIVGNRLTRDGAPWVPQGYFQVAFEAGANVPQQPFEANANTYWDPSEYTDMVAAHADSVRFMISQPGADSTDPLYDPTLAPKVIKAVQAARAAGLTVILGIQDEKVVGRDTRTGLPTQATLNVWAALMPALKDDKGVLLELYNEPVISANQTIADTDWQKWAAAMNMTIAAVRGYGSTNVLVADGLDRAIILQGAPALTDPLNQIAYAAHPYVFSADDETTDFLDRSFGDFATQHPVIITEWGMGYFCGPKDPAFLITFFNYLQQRGIGLEIGAWDWGSTGSFGNARYNFPKAPTLSRFYDVDGTFQACTSSTITDGKRGPGLTVDQWYRTGRVPASAL